MVEVLQRFRGGRERRRIVGDGPRVGELWSCKKGVSRALSITLSGTWRLFHSKRRWRAWGVSRFF